MPLKSQAIRLAEEDLRSRIGDSDSSSSSNGISEEDVEGIARVVGIGAVKYADLSMNRESNYRFSYKKMLALQGNTAPYMLYAYVRVQGIKRRALEALGAADLFSNGDAAVEWQLETPEEMALAKAILRFDEIVREIELELYPNKMCEYLFDVSQKFNQFYEQCPVLKAETLKQQRSRAALCALSAETLRLGLDLLGIRTVEKL